MPKALHIDSAAREVSEVEFAGPPELETFVRGYIAIGKIWDNGDMLFVDDELKQSSPFFRLAGNPSGRPYSGNGLLVGCDRYDGDNDDPTMTVDALRQLVEFLSPEQVLAWAQENSNEPVSTISFGDDGLHVKITGRVGELYGVEPKPNPAHDEEASK